MQCFYHPLEFAIGTCKSCCRGLCRECAAEVEPGLACIGKCEEGVANLNAALDRSTHAISRGVGTWSAAATLYMVLGALFLAWGVLSEMYFIAAIGFPFAAYAMFLFYRARQLSKVGDREPAA